MVCTTEVNEPLIACLRLVDADAQLLEAAIGKLELFQAFRVRPSGSAKGLADVRSIDTPQGALYSLVCRRPLTLDAARHAEVAMVYVRKGRIEITDHNDGREHCAGDTVYLAPDREVTIVLDAQSEAYFLRPRVPPQAGALEQFPPHRVIEHYLQQARFFPGYATTVEATAELLQGLGAESAGRTPASGAPLGEPLDARVLKAVGLMENDPHWVFDLRELARHVGASERNLYYLMQDEIGMPPYRYYQRTRLLRARIMLVDCRNPAPSISWVAIQQGFYHLGRFSALYRGHFGELPSETLEWVSGLLKHPALVGAPLTSSS